MVSIKKLLKVGQQIPETDILIAYLIYKDRAFVLSHQEYNLSLWQTAKFHYYLRLLKTGYPWAYITGHKEFFGLDFNVNKHTLIPRPDTEIMVEEALKNLTGDSILIDVGTGTSCIPISILKHANFKPAATYAIDISSRALEVAQKNAAKYEVNINFIQGNLLFPLLNSSRTNNLFNQPVIVTANLPYLTPEQVRIEPSIQYEPKTALISDNTDGLELYHKLLAQISEQQIKKTLVLLEIDPTQSAKITTLANKFFPSAKIEIKKDLAGRDRLVAIKINW